jgi:hypothetical protein
MSACPLLSSGTCHTALGPSFAFGMAVSWIVRRMPPPVRTFGASSCMATERIGASTGGKGPDVQNVILVHFLLEAARRHVLDLALVQWAIRPVEHRENCCLAWSWNPAILGRVQSVALLLLSPPRVPAARRCYRERGLVHGLVTGVVHARVEERHRSREFVDLLKQDRGRRACPWFPVFLIARDKSRRCDSDRRQAPPRTPLARLAPRQHRRDPMRAPEPHLAVRSGSNESPELISRNVYYGAARARLTAAGPASAVDPFRSFKNLCPELGVSPGPRSASMEGSRVRSIAEPCDNSRRSLGQRLREGALPRRESPPSSWRSMAEPPGAVATLCRARAPRPRQRQIHRISRPGVRAPGDEMRRLPHRIERRAPAHEPCRRERGDDEAREGEAAQPNGRPPSPRQRSARESVLFGLGRSLRLSRS